MIVNHWKRGFTKQYGHVFPETYCCVDCEYTTGATDRAVVVEIGHVLVVDREIDNKLNLVLDWTNSDIVPLRWLEQQIADVTYRMAQTGGVFRVNTDVMREDGVEAKEALSFYLDFFRQLQAKNIPFVAHNGYRADERLLSANFAGFLAEDFDFGDSGLIDTGALYKATELLARDPHMKDERTRKCLPNPNETMRSYCKRIIGMRTPGVQWGLAHVVKQFDLPVDMKDHHTAGFDAEVLYHLMEHFRTLIKVNHAREAGYESPQALRRMLNQTWAAEAEKEAKRERLEPDPFEAKLAVPEEPPTPKVNRRRRRGQRN